MCYITRRKLKTVLFLLLLLTILHFFGVFVHLYERDFYQDFHYPYDGDIEEFVQQLKHNETPKVPPINAYYFKYYSHSKQKCDNVYNLRLVYVIKSSPENFDRRIAIRSTWGYERRFSDVEIRTVFLLGWRNSTRLQASIDKENGKFGDIVQGNFTDSYFNNTYKTVMGLDWAVKFCSRAKFYMFVDDDFYISTKNVLRFVRFPTNYPQYLKEPMANVKAVFSNRKIQQDFELEDNIRLYTGFVFHSSPLRHYSSKWYVSYQEYPYHMWPPYVTAGAYILSREALKDIYFASYYTKHFRFDDIYMGLLAFKTKIEPFHSDEFYYYRKSYNRKDYEYVVASHGFGNPEELLRIWTEQKSLGNA